MFKGQRGRVTKVNGEEAIIELSTRHKKISILKTDIKVIDPEGEYSSYRTENAGG
jgi:transcription elongation factor